MRPLLLGLDIGGTKTAVALGHSPVEVLAREEFPTGAPQPTLNLAVAAARRLLAARGGQSPAAVGVACGGPLDAEQGVILSPPNLPGWSDVPVVELVTRVIPAPARLENDANAGALAEHRYGAGRGVRDFVFVTFGTGLGAGLVLGGRLHRGASGMAGEIGHVRLAPDGPFAHGKHGSAEGFASGAGLAQIARRCHDEAGGRGSSLAGLGPEELTARAVVRAALDGDELAGELVAECGRGLGRALAVLADLVNPEVIAVGGLAVPLGDLVLIPARREMLAEALPEAGCVCRVVPAQLGEGIGDAQALVLAEMVLEGSP
jgi:glucokinase